MLASIKTIKGCKLNAIDGQMGRAKEFYFDDIHWTIRYLVADTGNWLPGRQVLISPYALNGVAEDGHHLEISLTKEEIAQSPSIDTHKPVSRQFERAYLGHHGWPKYWEGSHAWGAHHHVHDHKSGGSHNHDGKSSRDHHLRSTNAVAGYHIQATDGEIGHVEDFIIEDQTWKIRYLVAATSNWGTGRKVLVSPQWIERVSWRESKAFASLTRETIRLSPEYSEKSLLTRDYEAELHRHYDRQGYWVEEPAMVHA